jgi:tRNA threonylcarbamoyl adenosine modification protein YeaZ
VHTLYIDLASNKGNLALVTEQEVLAIEHIDQRLEDQELLPRVEKTLQIANCKLQDLTHIACVVGPGGFMSLRVAVALANTLADQLNIPICGVHLSDVYKAKLPARLLAGTDGQIANCKLQSCLWLHSTKKQELFVREFGDNAKMWPEATHVTLEAFIEMIGRDVRLSGRLYAGELIPEHQAVLAEPVGALRAMPLQEIEDILPTFLQHHEYKKQILEPWYGRGW